SSAVPLYYLSRFAREHVKVVLSGEGGDEVFGGYETYVADKLARWYRALPGMLSRSLIPNLVGRLPVSHRRVSFDYKAKRFVQGELKLRGFRKKYLLKRAMRDRLPRSVLRGPKRGFNVPMPRWLARDLQEFVRDTLSPERIAANGVFRPETVTRLIDEHTRQE